MRPFFSIAMSLSILMSLVNPALAAPPPATTPIQHIVVIFGENISFDHYFGTYPTPQILPDSPALPRFPIRP